MINVSKRARVEGISGMLCSKGGGGDGLDVRTFRRIRLFRWGKKHSQKTTVWWRKHAILVLLWTSFGGLVHQLALLEFKNRKRTF